MGKYNKGILGAFSGKVGPVVGSSWRGRDVLRSRPRKSNKVASQLQAMQREKFTLVSNFITPLMPVVGRYFGRRNSSISQKNQCTRYFLREVVQHDGTQAMLDYPKILVTRGELLPLQNAIATVGTGTNAEITWTNNSNQGNAKPTDLVLVVAYEPDSQQTWYFLEIATRADLSTTVALPTQWAGKTVYLWSSVVSEDDKLFAVSNYLQSIDLPG